MEIYYLIIGIIFAVCTGDLLYSNFGQTEKGRNPMGNPLGTIVGIEGAPGGSKVSIVLKQPLTADEYVDLGDPVHVFRVTDMRDRNGQPTTRAEKDALITIELPLSASQLVPGLEVWPGFPLLAANGG